MIISTKWCRLSFDPCWFVYCLSILACPPVCLSICLSICLPICLSVSNIMGKCIHIFHEIFRISLTWVLEHFGTFRGKLFHVWLNCFIFLNLCAVGFYALGVLLVSEETGVASTNSLYMHFMGDIHLLIFFRFVITQNIKPLWVSNQLIMQITLFYWSNQFWENWVMHLSLCIPMLAMAFMGRFLVMVSCKCVKGSAFNTLRCQAINWFNDEILLIGTS